MSEFKVIAIRSELADQVRATRRSPGYGHPVSSTVATGHGPCRHCLQPFLIGTDVRLLFTLDPFDGVAPIPQPGPVFVHEVVCSRYAEDAGYPPELISFGAVLDGYDAQQFVQRREIVTNGSHVAALRRVLDDPIVRYVMVRDVKAGYFDFRVERGES